MSKGVKLTGASGEYISTPTVSAFTPTSSIEGIVRANFVDWTSDSVLLARFASSTSGSFLWRVKLTGFMEIVITDPTPINHTYANLLSVLTNGNRYWVRVLATLTDIRFYYSEDQEDIPTVWTQIGSAIPSTHTGYRNQSLPLELGSRNSGSSDMSNASFYKALLKIDGVLVADWSAPHSGIRHRDSTGKIWTINGSAYSTVID